LREWPQAGLLRLHHPAAMFCESTEPMERAVRIPARVSLQSYTPRTGGGGHSGLFVCC